MLIIISDDGNACLNILQAFAETQKFNLFKKQLIGKDRKGKIMKIDVPKKKNRNKSCFG